MKLAIYTALAMLALNGTLCVAQSPAPATSPSVQPAAITLAAGTPITVVLDKTIKSNGTREGDPVMLHTSAAVYSSDPSHTLFIAKGAIAMGHIIVSSKRGYIGRRGDLQFQIDYVMDVNNDRVYLTNQCIGGAATDRGALSIAATVVVGYAGLLIQGGDKKYAADTQFTVYVDQPAALAPKPD